MPPHQQQTLSSDWAVVTRTDMVLLQVQGQGHAIASHSIQ